MNEKTPTGARNGAPKIGRSLDDRSPILGRVEGEERRYARRIGIRIAIGFVALAAAAVVGELAFRHRSVPDDMGASSGPCVPGENQLDCLDRLHDEEVGDLYPALLPGLDVDGCSVLSEADQLRSPLCCPHVSPNLGDCPKPSPGMGFSVEGGRAVILDADSLVPGTQGGGAQ